MADTEKWFKVTTTYLKANFLLCTKSGKWGIFRPQIIVFELYSKSFHLMFWKLYLMA